MEKQTIQFIAHEFTIQRVPTDPCAFEFEPSGRLAWLYKMLWKFLHAHGVLKHHLGEHFRYTSHTIEPDKFMHAVLSQQDNLRYFHGIEPRTILVGAEDYKRMVASSDFLDHARFDFKGVDFRSSEYGRRKEAFGMEIKVIPWMRGILVM